MSDSNERLSLGMRLLIMLGVVVALIIIVPLVAICAIGGWHAVVREWHTP